MMSTAIAMGRVVVKPKRSGPFFARHPWVLDASIARVLGSPADGSVVDLVTDRDQFIARGIFNSQSRIRVRLYAWSDEAVLDEDFWRGRLSTALALRALLRYDDPAGATRLVFSEADGLSGLIVDRYGPDLAVQITARAMHDRLDDWLRLLTDAVQPRGIWVRTDPHVSQAEGFAPRNGLAYGEPSAGPIQVRQHGVTFLVDLREGQKTGFYLDQRENRVAAARYAQGRSVLDVCCYTGGFGLTALAHGGATESLGIDASAKAIAAATAHAELNGLANARFETGDCFESLQALASQGRRFGQVILDPPRFAGSRRVLTQAMSAYHKLNRLGVAVLEPGGILVTCSCSGHVTREMFGEMLSGVAQRTRRDIQILEQRGAAPDHPATTGCPETEYLKCFICRVL